MGTSQVTTVRTDQVQSKQVKSIWNILNQVGTVKVKDKNFLDQKFCTHNCLDTTQHFFVPENFLDQKILGTRQFFVPKIFSIQIFPESIFLTKNLLDPKSCLDQIF